jgi:DNA processing protein
MTIQRQELEAWLRLTQSSGVGNVTARKLLGAFGVPEAIFTQSVSALQQVVSSAQVSALVTTPPELASLLATTWDWLQHSAPGTHQRQVLTLGDAGYPQALLELDDPPLMLYLLGTAQFMENRPVTLDSQALEALDSVAKYLPIDRHRCLAVVGSRNPTPQGIENARLFSKTLAQAGLTIVSGLALGIDGAAHEGALSSQADHALTIAVVGTGLDRVYPKVHHTLAHRIAQNGVIISEYPLGSAPISANFPRRNRLIAALSRATLVVEATLKSGSLITARLSAEQGKDVFAIPGSIHATQSRGCHALIKQGAKLVESVQDVLDEFPDIQSIAMTTIATEARPSSATGLFDHEHMIREALGFDPVGLDALQARTGLETAQLQAVLMTLEMGGELARLPGGLFQRLISQ